MIKKQRYHLEPDIGLLNDPNGLVFYKGIYHVFFQWNRFEKNHSYKEWGHFTSKDMVHWEKEGSALVPDQLYEKNGVYSGSACIKGNQLFLYYTGNNKTDGVRKSSQCLAVTEDGKTFIKKGVILKTPLVFTEHFRDPKVWHTDDGYYMVVGAQKKNGKGAVALGSSSDGENWKYDGILAETDKYEMIECPDFFEINGQGLLVYCLQHRDNEMDASLESFSVYKKFPFHGGPVTNQNGDLDKGWEKLDLGFDFYAPQTFELPDGRRVLLAWMSRMSDEEEKKFSQDEKNIHCMTLPRELSLKHGELCQLPVKELEQILSEKEDSKESVSREGLVTDSRLYCLKMADISERMETDSLAVELQNGEAVIRYDREDKILRIIRRNWISEEYEEHSCKIADLNKLEIWSDVSSVEIFVNDGIKSFSMRVFPESDCGKIRITGVSDKSFVKVYDVLIEEED